MSQSKMITIPTSVRHERYELSDFKNTVVQVNNSNCALINISDSGISVINNENKLSIGEKVQLVVHFSEATKYNSMGTVLWANEHSRGNCYGIKFDKYLPQGILDAYLKIDSFWNEAISVVEIDQSISSEFRAITFKIKEYLTIMKERADKLEIDLQIVSEEYRKAYLAYFNSNIGPKFVENLILFNKQLDTIFSAIKDRNEKKKYIQFFKKHLKEYYVDNPFIGRALRKPRGYAGDFEMMNQIYRNSAEGKTIFESLMHLYGINEESSQSVRYRKGYLIEKIKSHYKKSEKIIIGSVACGPAREVVDFLREVDPEKSSNYTFILMDQDIESLLNAKRNINEQIFDRNLTCEIFYVSLSVQNILDQSEDAQFLADTEFHLLYTAGLYDYLSQPVAKCLTSVLLKSVKDSGEMIIGNFHPSNPTKTISELVADWKLVHRTEEDMFDLAYGEKVSTHLHKDPLGIDLFLEIKK